jgi:hypothetical protein
VAEDLVRTVGPPRHHLKETGAGADRQKMVPRPFARQSKKSGAEEIDPDGTEEPPQFFSSDPRPVESPADAPRPDRMIVREVPAAPLPDHAEAGWYPDPTEAGMMLYWDGFHMTGQAMRADPAVPQAERVAAGTPVPETVDTDAPNEAPINPDPPTAGVHAPPRSPAPVDELVPDTGDDEGPAPIPPSSVQVGPAPSVPPAVGVASPDPGGTSTEQPESKGETWTAMRKIGEAKADGEVDEVSEEPAVAIADEKDRVDQHASGPQLVSPAQSVSPESPPDEKEGDEARDWATETERAVARARETGTPGAWQEAAQVAVVVSEMAQTMQAAADTALVAAQTAAASREAAEAAKAADQKAADANQAVEQTTKAAREAAEAAKAAEQAAADARQAAEQSSRAAPRFAEAATAAAREAADAERKAQGLKEIVARAGTDNTAAAWSEALGLAAAATETEQGLVSDD